MDSGSRLCVVTVTHNSAPVLPGFLESLASAMADLEGVVDVQVVAVDNASSDGSVELLEDADIPVRVVRSATNDGYAAGINWGVAACADADAYLVLNPDTRLPRGAVEALLRCLQRPGTGVVVPRTVRADGSPRYSLRRRPTALRAWAELLLTGERAARIGSLGERVGDPDAYRSSHVVDWASGSAMLLSADCLRRTGPWDERFFLYSEETDFCIRARAAGYVTYYCADATVTHLGGGSRISPELHALLTTNRIRSFRKHNGPVGSASFALAIILKQLLRLVRGDRMAAAALRSIVWRSSRHPELLRLEERRRRLHRGEA